MNLPGKAPREPLPRRAAVWISRIANRPMPVTFVGLLKYGGALTALVGPLVVGIATWDPKMGAVLLVLYAAGLAASFLGPLANQGGSWLEASGKEAIDRAHSLDVTAGLRMLRDAQHGDFDARRLQDRLLKAIVATANQIAFERSAKVMACLFVPRGDHLEMIAFSDHRDGRIPSATVSRTEQEGAARAFRDGRLVHISDTETLPEGCPLRGKSYRSVMCFPLGEGSGCAGVVTVDSTHAKHFDRRLPDLTVHIGPFVELLHLSVRLGS